jgi:hypothetical protein
VCEGVFCLAALLEVGFDVGDVLLPAKAFEVGAESVDVALFEFFQLGGDGGN